MPAIVEEGQNKYVWRENARYWREIVVKYRGFGFRFQSVSTHCCGMNIIRNHDGLRLKQGSGDIEWTDDEAKLNVFNHLSDDDCRQMVQDIHSIANQTCSLVWQFPVDLPRQYREDYYDDEPVYECLDTDDYDADEFPFIGFYRALIRGGGVPAVTAVNTNSGSLLHIVVTTGMPKLEPIK